MKYLEIFFEKGKKRGTPEVGLYEEGANGVGNFIRGGITRDGKHDIFKGWEDLDIHGMS